MWNILCYIIVAGVSIASWDFCYTLKSYSGEPATTDAHRVISLYREIKNIRSILPEHQPTAYSILDTIYLYLRTIFHTGHTLTIFKYKKIQRQYYTPEKLRKSGLLILPYWLSGTWYNALVRHETGVSTVLKIMCGDDDVTLAVKPYMGPLENFYGEYNLTPSDLGYNSLTFTILHGGQLELITIQGEDIMGLLFKNSEDKDPVQISVKPPASRE